MLRSYLCEFIDTNNVVKGTINLKTIVNNDTRQKDVVLKNNVPFRSCITQINNILIDSAEDLDIAMPMHNLLEYIDIAMPMHNLSEYSDNYSVTLGSLLNYYRDEIDDVDDDASNGKLCDCNETRTHNHLVRKRILSI